MGTNYYTKAPADCPCCGRSFEPLHIGKSSGGWKFLFAPYPELNLTSWAAWQRHLEETSAEIVDEYGSAVSFEELRDLVESKQRPDMLDANNASSMQYGPTPRSERHQFETADPQGYRFSTTADFS